MLKKESFGNLRIFKWLFCVMKAKKITPGGRKIILNKPLTLVYKCGTM